jgi:hypothetical protein
MGYKSLLEGDVEDADNTTLSLLKGEKGGSWVIHCPFVVQRLTVFAMTLENRSVRKRPSGLSPFLVEA